ncbi:MAG: GvpL/GvpF family gas vesicle protein [Dehalococcoidia bacterium]
MAGNPQQLLYLYGITTPNSAAHALITARGVPGIELQEPLFPVEAGGLIAAVSRVPAATFDEAPLNDLVADLSRLTPYAVRHEEAVRALLGSALIPMTFGAVYRDPEGVAALLEERTGEFRRLLDRLEGRQEWGLKVFAQAQRIREATEAESPALLALAGEAAAATPGHAYLLTKKRDRMLAEESSRLAAAALAEILHRLAALSADAVQDDPGPDQPGAEQLALKAAFLVDTAAAEPFCATAVELERAHAPHGLCLELSGPWAPYSFVRTPGAHDA